MSLFIALAIFIMQITIFFIKINQIKTVSLFNLNFTKRIIKPNISKRMETKKMFRKKSVEILVITLHMRYHMMSEDVRHNLLLILLVVVVVVETKINSLSSHLCYMSDKDSFVGKHEMKNV